MHTTFECSGENSEALIGILYTKISHENDRKHFIRLGDLSNTQRLIISLFLPCS